MISVACGYLSWLGIRFIHVYKTGELLPTWLFTVEFQYPIQNHRTSGWDSPCVCLLLLISMLWHRQAIFEWIGDKLSSAAECKIRTQGLRHLFASRLNACWQTDWAIEDQAKNLNLIYAHTICPIIPAHISVSICAVVGKPLDPNLFTWVIYPSSFGLHYSDVIMRAMATQITRITIVY